MPIKQLQVLTSTEVADSPFRSLTEVEKYLEVVKKHLQDLEGTLVQYRTQFARAETAAGIEFTINRDKTEKKKGGGAKIGLDKIKIPKPELLRKNFSVLEDLSDQVEMLTSLFNTVSVNFRGVRGSNETLANIKAMKKTAESKVNEALKFLATVGQKHIPSEFKQMVEATIGYMSPHLTFRSNETSIYAYETKEENLAFSVYIKLYGLEDDEGNQHPEFYIVFTCILKPSIAAGAGKVDAHYYVTAMPDFQAPGKYLLGKEIETPASASAALGLMLEMENISTAIGIAPHGLDPTKITRNKFSVASKIAKLDIGPHTITFELLKNVSAKEAQALAATLYTELKGMMHRMPKAKLRAKLSKAADDRFVITYTMTNLARDSQINVNDIEFLREHFPFLDDRKALQIVKVINSD